MAESPRQDDGINSPPEEHLRQHLLEIVELLKKQKLEETIIQHQTMPHHDLVETLMHKQHQVAIKQKLDNLHSADIAYILEALPLEQRQQLATGQALPVGAAPARQPVDPNKLAAVPITRSESSPKPTPVVKPRPPREAASASRPARPASGAQASR